MESRGQIYLEVLAGLCNRLRALVAGIRFAEDSNRKLVIYWTDVKPECCAAFTELFAEGSLPSWVTVINSEVPKEKARLFKMCLSRDQLPSEPTDPTEDIYIRSYGCFYEGTDSLQWLQHFRGLKPHPNILSVVEAWKTKVGPSSLSVHIRRTDNFKSIVGSPLEAFSKRFKKESATQIFTIFSDDAKAVQTLEKEFPGQIIVLETVRARNTLKGMLEGAAVFFYLASSEKILGSVASSFSELAAVYGMCELECIRK
jgi:hypothetical protein